MGPFLYRKLTKISLSAWCFPPDITGVWGTLLSQLSLPGSAPLFSSHPAWSSTANIGRLSSHTNISVPLEPGELGVGNKTPLCSLEAACTLGSLAASSPETALGTSEGQLPGFHTSHSRPTPTPPPTSPEGPDVFCGFSRVASWAKPRRLPHPRSNTTVWFGRGHSAVQTTVCC